jgi:hypothetical protein
VAASEGELADHWGEAFIPPDDRDAAGIVHAEAAREVGGRERLRANASASASEATGAGAGAGQAWPSAFACLCGAAFDAASKLDEHLLSAFTPAGRAGLDGRPHTLAS